MLENTILSGLVFNNDYARKVIPFLSVEYFDQLDHRVVFTEIYNYIIKYNVLPSKEAIAIAIDQRSDLNENQYKEVIKLIDDLNYDSKIDELWLLDKTESFCQDKAIYNAVKRSILVLDGKDTEIDKGGIPQLLTKALAVSFDSNIGHDYIEQSESRYEFYHKQEDKIPFDLEYMNKITKGGVSKKSISIIMSGTGVGKTLFMTHCASSNLMSGLNVLYITMEMAEEKIAERIDANILNLTVDQVKELPKSMFEARIKRVKNKTNGKLIIKEYPTSSAGSANFRHLVNELQLKKNFKPDIIYIDYLNICISSRLRNSSINVNSYAYIKSIAEEIRGLAVELNLPIISATQTNRAGFSSSDPGIEDTSESFGLPATADFMVVMISTDELESLGQVAIKQLKNRWSDMNHFKKFVIGIDRSKMRLFDLEESAQEGITNNVAPDSKQEKKKRNFDSFR